MIRVFKILLLICFAQSQIAAQQAPRQALKVTPILPNRIIPTKDRLPITTKTRRNAMRSFTGIAKLKAHFVVSSIKKKILQSKHAVQFPDPLVKFVLLPGLSIVGSLILATTIGLTTQNLEGPMLFVFLPANLLGYGVTSYAFVKGLSGTSLEKQSLYIANKKAHSLQTKEQLVQLEEKFNKALEKFDSNQWQAKANTITGIKGEEGFELIFEEMPSLEKPDETVTKMIASKLTIQILFKEPKDSSIKKQILVKLFDQKGFEILEADYRLLRSEFDESYLVNTNALSEDDILFWVRETLGYTKPTIDSDPSAQAYYHLFDVSSLVMRFVEDAVEYYLTKDKSSQPPTRLNERAFLIEEAKQ